MIGTIVNTCTIIVGSIAGAAMNRGIKEKYKETLYTGLGLACLGIGLNAVISNFSKSEYPVLFIVSIAIGSIIGTALDLDGRFANLINKRSKGKQNTRVMFYSKTMLMQWSNTHRFIATINMKK